VWEDALRGGVQTESFIGRWVRSLLYYRAPEWVFTTLYAAWAAQTRSCIDARRSRGRRDQRSPHT
jgi:hypothetical protein